MLEKTHYANGQQIYALQDDKLTYYYKNGTLKAKGAFLQGMMQGEWVFYRESGQLWQVGHFQDDKKDGAWVRYDKHDKVEYSAVFKQGKQVKG